MSELGMNWDELQYDEPVKKFQAEWCFQGLTTSSGKTVAVLGLGKKRQVPLPDPEIFQPNNHCCWEYPLVMTNIANWKDPPFFMGKSTISMAIFNSYVKLPEGNRFEVQMCLSELLNAQLRAFAPSLY